MFSLNLGRFRYSVNRGVGAEACHREYPDRGRCVCGVMQTGYRSFAEMKEGGIHDR